MNPFPSGIGFLWILFFLKLIGNLSFQFQRGSPYAKTGTHMHHLQLLADKPDFQIMTVVFGEPISQIDRNVFEDVATWGVCSLQGWVNSYESVRFVAIDDHTAIITGEYNMEQVKVWLEKYTSIQSLKTS